MTDQTTQPDDLIFLRNCLENALAEDFIKISFKDANKPALTVTKIETVAGKEDSILVSDTMIAVFDVELARWIDLDLTQIEIAESVAIFQQFEPMEVKFE
jgi:hypothetical protein